MKNSFPVFKISCLILPLFVLALQPMPAFEGSDIPTENDLGVAASPELKPDAAGIKECGLTTSVKQKWTFSDVKTAGNNLVFLDNTREIFWFAQFTIKGSMKNDISRKYRIQWVSPGGQIFHEENFKSSLWNETFIKKSIKFDIPVKDSYIGRWRVRVWKKDTLVDDRYFEIIKTA